jgi:alpha-methylacyl-CoA racemase
MLLAFGMLAGILSARTTGKGQVVDCAMVDGAALLSALTWSLKAAGIWRDERGVNLLDTGRPFYDVYQCADGQWVAVGALEPEFFAVLKERMGLASGQHDPGLRGELTAAFASRDRAYWCDLLQASDACFAPILSLADAPAHPHNVARATFVEADGIVQPAPAPRFGATPAPAPRLPKDIA